jgi:hypothetical protein
MLPLVVETICLGALKTRENGTEPDSNAEDRGSGKEGRKEGIVREGK